MMPVVPGGLPSVPRLTVMPPSSSSSSPSAPTPVALVPNIAAGNNSITIQVKSLISDLHFHCLKSWCITFCWNIEISVFAIQSVSCINFSVFMFCDS